MGGRAEFCHSSTMVYGQQAGGTHSTGMHSYLKIFRVVVYSCSLCIKLVNFSNFSFVFYMNRLLTFPLTILTLI